MQCVPRELNEERLLGLGAPLHKRCRAIGHAEDVYGVGGLELISVLIAGVAIRLVKTVLFWTAAANVPLAVMSRRVTRLAQDVANCRFVCRDASDVSGLN